MVYASHSLAQGIRRVIATYLARFIQHLPVKNDPHSMSLCPEACYRQGYKAAGIEFKL